MRHLITIGCLLAAIFFYSRGAAPVAGFLLLGLAFESAFWIRLLRRKRAS